MPLSTALRSLLLSAALVVVLSCGVGSHDTVTGPDCASVAGTYDGSFTNSCGGTGSGPVLVTQNGCTFNAIIPGLAGGSIAGQISGRNAAFTLYFSTPCSGSATGTATVGSRQISGTFSGNASGFGCCGPVSGSFTLNR